MNAMVMNFLISFLLSTMLNISAWFDILLVIYQLQSNTLPEAASKFVMQHLNFVMEWIIFIKSK